MKSRLSGVWWGASLSLVSLVFLAEIEPQWLWEYFTSWNLILVYAACACIVAGVKNCDALADTATVLSWTTAVCYSVVLAFSPERSQSNTAVFWSLNVVGHYLFPILLTASISTAPTGRLPVLAASLLIVAFYLATHNIVKAYEVESLSVYIIYIGPFFAVVLCFGLFLRWGYLSAHSLFWKTDTATASH